MAGPPPQPPPPDLNTVNRIFSPLPLLMLCASALLAAGWWHRHTLPEPARLRAEVTQDPAQTDTLRAPFSVRAGSVDYRVRPLQDYDISGLVVSLHHTDAWWDWIHAAANDHLNVVDLCVVWGANALSGAYQRTTFSSGQFVCYASSHDREAVSGANSRAISNNHLLSADPAVARQLKKVRIGDQIRLRGQLAEYSHNHGMAFQRGTSLTRDDGGNGACETVYVQDVALLAAAPRWPRLLTLLGAAGWLLALVMWWRQPMRASH